MIFKRRDEASQPQESLPSHQEVKDKVSENTITSVPKPAVDAEAQSASGFVGFE